MTPSFVGSALSDLSTLYSNSDCRSRPGRQPVDSTGLTRRSFLASSGVALGGLTAGCTGETTVSSSNDEEIGRVPSDAITDYDYIHLRNDQASPVITIDDTNRLSRWLIVSEDDLDRIEFTTATEGSSVAEQFLESTQFDEESVIVHQRTVEECYLLHLEYVVARPDRYRVQFCQLLRDADDACRANVEVMQATFIKIPVSYDDRPSSSGSGRRSTCHDPPDELPEIGVVL